MTRFYLNTYAPLVFYKAGRIVSQEHDLPPFIDGSIRREPDLEHRFPSISCLCRSDKFAPRLQEGDVVAYLTKKAKYQSAEKQRRLTAVLQVKKTLSSHAEAARWYRDRNHPLPSNCIVPGNRAKPYELSHHNFYSSSCVSDARKHSEWDDLYRSRAREWGNFVICRCDFRDLSWNAPVVLDRHLIDSFGKVPGTRNPGSLPGTQFRRFLKPYKISVPPSSP